MQMIGGFNMDIKECYEILGITTMQIDEQVKKHRERVIQTISS